MTAGHLLGSPNPGSMTASSRLLEHSSCEGRQAGVRQWPRRLLGCKAGYDGRCFNIGTMGWVKALARRNGKHTQSLVQHITQSLLQAFAQPRAASPIPHQTPSGPTIVRCFEEPDHAGCTKGRGGGPGRSSAGASGRE
jgi:hypothetical protein